MVSPDLPDEIQKPREPFRGLRSSCETAETCCNSGNHPRAGWDGILRVSFHGLGELAVPGVGDLICQRWCINLPFRPRALASWKLKARHLPSPGERVRRRRQGCFVRQGSGCRVLQCFGALTFQT